ncbi:hypothetical protein DFS33DRAFT_1361557 [Desarmillaria ectypa]|nr:hypothetical protein DFS33DRAFT_1361557 [Desarmillaria ectypa]
MANDSPPQSLALSDIMHTLSPSPGPQHMEQSQYANGTDTEERARSLDPPQEIDLKSYRNKLAEMGLLSGENESATPHELELANMVLSLIDARQWDPTQLFEQAETISGLMQERELMLQLFSEERARWKSEKEGWERSAEALISQKTKEAPDTFKTEQLTYFNSLLESDNKAKTEKLQDTLARLSSLEAELAKLKPILLLQPFSPSARPSHSALVNASTYLSSLPYPAATGDSALVAQKQRGARKKKKDKDLKAPLPAHGGSDEDKHAETALADSCVAAKSDTEGSGEQSALTSTLPALDPSLSASNTNGQTSYLSAAQDSMTSSPQSRHFRFAVDIYAHLRPKNVQSSVPASSYTIIPPSGQTVYSKKGRPAKTKETNPPQPAALTSDARTEHILLAARKIGRQRATIISSVAQAERQRDIAREQERLEKERASERSRPAAASGSSSHYRRDAGVTSPRTPKRGSAPSVAPASGPNHYLHVAGSPRGVPTGYLYTPSPGAGLYQHLLTPQARQVGRRPNQSPAAGSSKNPPTPLDSLVDAALTMAEDSPPGRRRRRAASPESPLQKRRRVSSARANANANASASAGVSSSRTRSALDVLADQAAAYGDLADKEKEKETAGEQTGMRRPRATRARLGKGKEPAAPRIISPAPRVIEDRPGAEQAKRRCRAEGDEDALVHDDGNGKKYGIEEEEKAEVPRRSYSPPSAPPLPPPDISGPGPDADVDADGDIDPDIDMEPSSSPRLASSAFPLGQEAFGHNHHGGVAP